MIIATILGTIAFSSKSYASLSKNLCTELKRFPAFSALRAYALSDRNVWLAGIIIILALSSPAITIVSLPGFRLRLRLTAHGNHSFKALKSSL